MSPHAIWDDGRRGPGEMLAEMARESRNAEDDVTSGDVWPVQETTPEGWPRCSGGPDCPVPPVGGDLPICFCERAEQS